MRTTENRLAFYVVLPDDTSGDGEYESEPIVADCECTISPESAVAAYLAWFNKEEPAT